MFSPSWTIKDDEDTGLGSGNMLQQNAAKPLYEQLMEAIRADIEAEIYRPGDKLPTESELEKIYKVSRITVRRAVKEPL